MRNRINRFNDEANEDQPLDESSPKFEFNVRGPYEGMLTRLFDEIAKIAVVIGLWAIGLAKYITPRKHMDLIEGLEAELEFVEGDFAKLLWCLGALTIAVRYYLLEELKPDA